MMNNNQSFSVCFMFIFLFFLKVSFLKSNSRVPSGFDRQNSRDNSSNFSSQQQLFDNNNSGSYLGQQQQDYFPYQSESNRYRDSTSPSSSNQASSSSSMKVDNFVFNVEGLSSPMWNCERVFNLLCLYGNVLCVSNELNLRENVRNSFLFRWSFWNRKKAAPWFKWIIAKTFDNIWKIWMQLSYSVKHLLLCKLKLTKRTIFWFEPFDWF